MQNPFEELDKRLSMIERFLREIHKDSKNTSDLVYLDVEQSAALLNISKPDFYNLIHKKAFPAFSRGKSLYMIQSDIEKYSEKLKRNKN